MGSEDKNLTGEQIQQTLDLFLYKALEPIILNSDSFDCQVMYLLSLISQNRKRKLSSLSREVSIENLCRFLTINDKERRREKFEIIRNTRIERSFIHTFISKFIKAHEGFLKTYNEWLTSSDENRKFLKSSLDITAESVNCTRQDLYRMMNISQNYLTNFYNYRSNILEHYLKHSSNQTKSYISSNRYLHFDFKDARQSILKNILIAIDKYDSNKGALTTYINWWILNAQTSSTSDHEYGIAYVIPQSHRKKIVNREDFTGDVNFSVSLDVFTNDNEADRDLHSTVSDKTDMSDTFIEDEHSRIIQYLIKSVDIRGCARLYLDVGEYFSESERKLMENQMKEENCK